jgi:hypothetical protein
MMVDQTIGELAPVIGTRAACAALGRSRATYYREHRQSPLAPRPPRAQAGQPRALSAAERAEVLGVLHADRFVDQAPASIYATLLDDGRYLCSVPTMYRLLRAEDEVRERRRQATHPARCWEVLGWSSLVAGALMSASLLNAGVTNGTGGVVHAAPTRILSSPATAALADGDDVRARFLADAPEAICQLSAGQPLYAGLNTWVAETHWSCEASSR